MPSGPKSKIQASTIATGKASRTVTTTAERTHSGSCNPWMIGSETCRTANATIP
jgi:hypothetical protein